MSSAENPILVVVPDPARQLPPANNSFNAKVENVAAWAGRAQARVGQFFARAYRNTCDGSVALAKDVRDRTVKMKEENPLALIGGIAGTAFAIGVAARVWRSRR